MPLLAAVGGYWLTGYAFQRKDVPYPFEWFGVAAALGFGSLAYALVYLFKK